MLSEQYSLTISEKNNQQSPMNDTGYHLLGVNGPMAYAILGVNSGISGLKGLLNL